MICKSIKSLTHTSYSSVRTRFVSSPLTRKTFLMSLVWCSTLPQAYTCYCAFYKMETSIFASEYPTRQFLKSTFLSLCSWTGVWFNGSNCPTQLNNTEMYCEDLAAVCSSVFSHWALVFNLCSNFATTSDFWNMLFWAFQMLYSLSRMSFSGIFLLVTVL